jgi:carbamoyltransferase
MATILGLSCYYHDSAAALVRNGHIVAAAQEERFTRKKHDHSFPCRAVEYCLSELKESSASIDHVVFYEKPLLKFDRLLETYLAFAPAGLPSFLSAMPSWLDSKLHLPKQLTKELRPHHKGPILFTRHHESHAASAFFPSPFEEAAILNMDGVGEWDCTTLGSGHGNQLSLKHSQSFPHSLGLLYSSFTYHCGFKVNSGEYKLMGLAPYGSPVHKERILDELLDLRDDGSFRLNLEYFNFCQGLTMTSTRFDQLFGGPPRTSETQLDGGHTDIAASIQAVTEEIILKTAAFLRDDTGMDNLCMAGGVALNCVANGKLARSGLFRDLWVQPAAGDAGGALGAALYVHHQLLGNERAPNQPDSMQGSLLGPSYTSDEIGAFLDKSGAVHERFQDENDLLAETARAIEDGQVVGWFQGRMEFGPRALGSRSILGDPRNPEMQAKMNLSIKYRESFRPFAPIILAEDASEYFELEGTSPYMLVVAPVRENIRRPLSDEDKERMRDPDLIKRVNIPRSDLPAITHIDMSARIQTVDERHGRLRRLLLAFKERTGCPVLVNTSFNVRGEPIVCTPEEAYDCFLGTEMDMLVLENCILEKKNQPELSPEQKQAYLERFELD